MKLYEWLTILAILVALALAALALWMYRYEYRPGATAAYLVRIDRLTSSVCAVPLSEYAKQVLRDAPGVPALCE